MTKFNIGKKIKEAEKKIRNDDSEERAKEKRIRKGRKRRVDAKKSQDGKGRRKLRWYGKEQ